LSQHPSLARQYTVRLALTFILMEPLVAGLSTFFVVLPLARRSADDVAGLMVLSVQTWAELHPQTRPAFEQELLASHALALRAELPGPGSDEWHPPYFYLLEDALALRTGLMHHLSSESLDTGTWYWAEVPTGNGHLVVGLSATRIDSQPVTALAMALLVGLLFAMAVALWLARRLTEPLARLEAASAPIGQGAARRCCLRQGRVSW
jgi:two-component system osmolarity sensor histidine kinase EnvZ